MIYINPPVPLLMAFMTCEGVKLGRGDRWINKLYRVIDNQGQGWLVSPPEIVWAWL